MSCWILGFVLGDFTLSQLCLVAEGCDSFWKWGGKEFPPQKCRGDGGAGSWPRDVSKASCPGHELPGLKDLIKAQFCSKPGFDEPPCRGTMPETAPSLHRGDCEGASGSHLSRWSQQPFPSPAELPGLPGLCRGLGKREERRLTATSRRSPASALALNWSTDRDNPGICPKSPQWQCQTPLSAGARVCAVCAVPRLRKL